MSKKQKAKVKQIPSILNAALEDAFDECKTPDEMSELSKLLTEKMAKIYWTKKNFKEDGIEDD